MVISGFFSLVDGQGLPLQNVLEFLKDNDYVPDWIDFLESSIDKRWNLRSTLEKISYACDDVYGTEYSKIVLSKLKLYIIDKYGK